MISFNETFRVIAHYGHAEYDYGKKEATEQDHHRESPHIQFAIGQIAQKQVARVLFLARLELINAEAQGQLAYLDCFDGVSLVRVVASGRLGKTKKVSR